MKTFVQKYGKHHGGGNRYLEPLVGIETKICTEFTALFTQRSRVSFPCSLCCLHLQMAMTTLEQPTST